MSEDPRCDVHGPFTAAEAAAVVRGREPPRTGYVCPECQRKVNEAAAELADLIDRHVVESVYRELGIRRGSVA